MEDWERKKIQSAIDAIDTCTLELKVQVLNNVDAQMTGTAASHAEKEQVRTFIKNPIVNIVSRLGNQKMNLMKLIHEIHSPSKPV